jgi:hypothetical protein
LIRVARDLLWPSSVDQHRNERRVAVHLEAFEALGVEAAHADQRKRLVGLVLEREHRHARHLEFAQERQRRHFDQVFRLQRAIQVVRHREQRAHREQVALELLRHVGRALAALRDLGFERARVVSQRAHARAAAQGAVHLGVQFTERHGLDEKVVGAAVERLQAGVDTVLGGKEQDGRVVAVGVADVLEHAVPGHVG